MKFTFFRIPSHRRFSHAPIYYDEAKEEREAREARVREEIGVPAPPGQKQPTIEDRIKGKMRRRVTSRIDVTRKARRASTLRLVVILIALFTLFYYLLSASRGWYERFFLT